MTARLLILLLFALGIGGADLALTATRVEAAVTCERTEQEGCLEIDIVAVYNNRHVPEIQELLASGAPGEQKVSAVLDGDIGLMIYKAAEQGRAEYYPHCFKVPIRFWRVTTPVPTSRMMEYFMPPGSTSRGIAPKPRKVTTPFLQTKTEIRDPRTGVSGGYAVEYVLEVCGGKGALQVPWDFLPPGATIQIEPLEATEFPWTLKEAKAQNKKVALWLTADRINYYRQDGGKKRKEYVVLPIIFPSKVQ